jgi:glutathione synthase/RimK-type ligase-like ATP-grasp enzyme
MPDVVIVKSQDPAFPEIECELLAAALTRRGVEAGIEAWGSDPSGAKLVVIRTPWDYTKQCDRFLSWAREVADAATLVNPYEVIAWNSHKSYLLDLAYAGVPMIPTALVAAGAPVAEQLAMLEEYEGEVVIKPAIAVGGVGALRAVARSTEASDHLAAMATDVDMLVQPFEPTVTDGEVSLIFLGGEYSHAVRKLPAEGEYRVHEMYGGTIELHTPTGDELAVGLAALAVADDELAYGRVDLLATPRGPAVMELELIEPQLFLDLVPEAPDRLAAHLQGLLV